MPHGLLRLSLLLCLSALGGSLAACASASAPPLLPTEPSGLPLTEAPAAPGDASKREPSDVLRDADTLERSDHPGSLESAGRMFSPRAAHSATALQDGRVLLAGGFSRDESSPADAEIYDPASGTFTLTGPMQTPRYSHAATRLADGRVLLTGGYDAGAAYLQIAEIFDPASDSFADAGLM